MRTPGMRTKVVTVDDSRTLRERASFMPGPLAVRDRGR